MKILDVFGMKTWALQKSYSEIACFGIINYFTKNENVNHQFIVANLINILKYLCLGVFRNVFETSYWLFIKDNNFRFLKKTFFPKKPVFTTFYLSKLRMKIWPRISNRTETRTEPIGPNKQLDSVLDIYIRLIRFSGYSVQVI